MNKYQFIVKDMTCEGCAGRIRDALKRVTGVENVDINVNTHLVTVKGIAEEESLKKAIINTGYTPTVFRGKKSFLGRLFQ